MEKINCKYKRQYPPMIYNQTEENYTDRKKHTSKNHTSALASSKFQELGGDSLMKKSQSSVWIREYTQMLPEIYKKNESVEPKDNSKQYSIMQIPIKEEINMAYKNEKKAIQMRDFIDT